MKTVLITGSSRGIGRETAIYFAQQGWNVIIHGFRHPEKLESLKNEILEENVSCLSFCGDISDPSFVDEMIKQSLLTFSKIDCLVNNAGINKDGLILSMSEEDFDSVINTNLKGTFNCIKFVSKSMIKNRYGKIINISSISGVAGNPGQANYAASKAGIIGLTKSVAKELAKRNINVNAIAPGFIMTEMTDVLRDKVKENILSQIPLKRFGTPQDVAELAAFLASDKSSYITGQVINLDGGMIM